MVVSYNTASLLDQMFAALDAARGRLRIQIIVIDNASRDGSAAHLRTKYPDVELIENSVNVGFGRANNQAMSKAKGRYILLLNTDAFVAPDTLSKTMQYMEANPRCGVLGVKLVGPDGSLQPSCRYFPTPWNVFLKSTGLMRLSPKTRLVDDMSWDHNSIRECDWVPGCYYLIRREVIEQIGLFDPIYFLYYEEVDHCRTVQNAGWKVIYYPSHASGPHRWRECTDGRRTIKERSTNIGATTRKRASLLSQTFWISRSFTRGTAVPARRYPVLRQRDSWRLRLQQDPQRCETCKITGNASNEHEIWYTTHTLMLSP